MVAAAPIPGSGVQSPAIAVHGNVEGSIQVGDHNLLVNDNHGTIVVERVESRRRRRPVAPPPRPPQPFIGRGRELERLAAAIGARQAVTLSGEVGAGRTALTRAAASQPDSGTPGGVLRIDGVMSAGGRLSLGDLAQRIHDAVWECVPAAKVTLESARSQLGRIDAVAIIDDVSIAGAELERLADLLPSGAVLIATRQTPMESDLNDVVVGPLPRAQAVALLSARADLAQAQPLDPSTAGHLDALCELLHDWPGALVVAGRAMAVGGLSAERARAALSGTPMVGPPHEAALLRAYRLARPSLDEHALRLLVAASVIPGASHDPRILRRTLGDPAWFDAAAETLETLELLVRNSPRYFVPDGLRAIVAGEAGEAAAEIRHRHVNVALAAATERALDPTFAAVELGGQLGAFEWAVRYGRFEDAIHLGRAITSWLVLHGLWDAWRSVVGQVAAAAEQIGATDAVAWAAHEHGTRALALGERRAAEAQLRYALKLRRAAGDDAGAAYTLHNLQRLGVDGDGRWRFILGGALVLMVLIVGLGGPGVMAIIQEFIATESSPAPTNVAGSGSPDPSPTMPTMTPTSTAGTATPTQADQTSPATATLSPTPLPPLLTVACVTFDEIGIGTVWGEPSGQEPGDEVHRTVDGVRVTVHDFLYSTDGGTFNYAEILPAADDFGSGPYVWFNNLNLELDFTELPFVPSSADFTFRDSGGNQNLSVNLSDIHRDLLVTAPSPIGGASWSTSDPEGDQITIGSLAGAVERILVGGQELALDTVCAYR